MRFLIVTDLPEVGGSSTICLTLVQKFISWGHDVTVLTRWHKGYKVSEGVLAECKQLGVEVVWINAPGGRYGLGPLVALWTLVERARPDMILANGTGWMAPLLGMLFPEKQLGYFYINHDERAPLFQRLRWFSLFVDRFAVITPMSLGPLGARARIKKPVWWLPQFSQPANCGISLVNERVTGTGGAKAGFVGLLSEPKGVPCLLALWQKLQLPGELRFVGKGPCLELVKQAEAATAEQINGRVYYHGGFDARNRDAYLKAFFEQVDFLVMPTIIAGEGTPTVILEALAFGVPVLATDEGGTACFKLPWLAAPDLCMVEAVPIAELGEALVRYNRSGPFRLAHRQAIQRYFNRFFSDEVVGYRWRGFVCNRFSII